MRASGVHVITSGNHIWQKKDIYPVLQTSDTLLRPENYPVIAGPGAIPGKGHCIVTVRDIGGPRHQPRGAREPLAAPRSHPGRQGPR